ncbi:33425_t:CDS:10, partial [Racocetra persica]
MEKINNFKLDTNFCEPYSSISRFFSKIRLSKWNQIDRFTKFIYDMNPNISSQKILDIYNRSLNNILTIQGINRKVVLYTRKIYEQEDQAKRLKTIGDTLIKIQRATIINKTRSYFQIAKKQDHMNRKDNIYIDWDDENVNINRNNALIQPNDFGETINDHKNKHQTINTNEPSEISFNSEVSVYTNNTDKNVNYHKNKRRAGDEIESSDLEFNNLDEIGSFFQSSSSRQGSGNDFLQNLQKSKLDKKKINPSFVSSNQSKEEKSFEYEDFENEDSESVDKNHAKPAPLLLSLNRKYFMEFYAKMNKSKKWILPSGTCVEDVLFHEGISLSTESLIHSWTIDLSDLETKKLFTDEDWCEIEKTVYKQPLIDENVAKTLSRFRNIRETADLRTVLDTTSYKDKNEPFEQEKHFDAEWIEHVMRHLLIYYENSDQPLQMKHLEGWYDANIWSVVIDFAFNNVKGLEISRKDPHSISVAKRKNRKRRLKERVKIGRKLDGIFKTYDGIEYGAIEVQSPFTQINSLEQCKDGFKLGKSIHNMLACLAQAINFNEEKVRQLQVVGLQHS